MDPRRSRLAGRLGHPQGRDQRFSPYAGTQVKDARDNLLRARRSTLTDARDIIAKKSKTSFKGGDLRSKLAARKQVPVEQDLPYHTPMPSQVNQAILMQQLANFQPHQMGHFPSMAQIGNFPSMAQTGNFPSTAHTGNFPSMAHSGNFPGNCPVQQSSNFAVQQTGNFSSHPRGQSIPTLGGRFSGASARNAAVGSVQRTLSNRLQQAEYYGTEAEDTDQFYEEGQDAGHSAGTSDDWLLRDHDKGDRILGRRLKNEQEGQEQKQKQKAAIIRQQASEVWVTRTNKTTSPVKRPSPTKRSPAGILLLEAQRTGCHVVAENLNPAVTKEDVEELFKSIGPIRFLRMREGSRRAEVVFQHAEHAKKSVRMYNNRDLDEVPMIVYVQGPSTV